MRDKSQKKKQYILDNAREVFSRKGFYAVTMQDIVEACDISRGGLYLYYKSTGEIFCDILQQDYEGDDSEAVESVNTPSDILAVFFREQKRELLKKGPSLLRASYEYLFSKTDDEVQGQELARSREQFESGVMVLEQILSRGMDAGEFLCSDVLGCAENIMYVLEGMRIRSGIAPLSEAAVDRQLLYIMEQIVNQ